MGISDSLRDKFEKFVEKHQNDIFYIIITQVDPDAIGSAFGLKSILGCLNIQSEIYYCGYFGHPQNRAIINRYDLNARMSPIFDVDIKAVETNNADQESRPKDQRSYIHYALVDSSTINDGRLMQLQNAISPRLVIDHHRGCDIPSTDDNFVLVEDVGSACTLITELGSSLNIAFTQDDIGVMLTMGIYTDTHELKASGKRDLEAFMYVKANVADDDFQKLVKYDFPETFYANIQTALANVTRHEDKLVSHVGYISPSEGDDLSNMSDLFIRKSGVSLVIVWGIINDKVRISARNTNLTVPLGDFLKNRFGPKSGAKLAPDGCGEGGGIIDLDLGFWIGETNKDSVLQMVTDRINELVFSPE